MRKIRLGVALLKNARHTGSALNQSHLPLLWLWCRELHRPLPFAQIGARVLFLDVSASRLDHLAMGWTTQVSIFRATMSKFIANAFASAQNCLLLCCKRKQSYCLKTSFCQSQLCACVFLGRWNGAAAHVEGACCCLQGYQADARSAFVRPLRAFSIFDSSAVAADMQSNRIHRSHGIPAACQHLWLHSCCCRLAKP